MRLSTQYPSPRGWYERLEARSSIPPNFSVSPIERASLTVFGGSLNFGGMTPPQGTITYNPAPGAGEPGRFELNDHFTVAYAANNWVRFETEETHLGNTGDNYENRYIRLSSVLRILDGDTFVLERPPGNYRVEIQNQYASGAIDGCRTVIRPISNSGYGQVYIYANRSGNQRIFEVRNNGSSVFSVRASGRIYNAPALLHSDIAEYIPSRDIFESGSVVIINEQGKLSLTERAYDKRVAGIISTRPAIVMGSEEKLPAKEEKEARKTLKEYKEKRDKGVKSILALKGTVPCLAEATEQEIKPGDILVTSSVPGYVRKAEKYIPGTVVGKALSGLRKGEKGFIMVLIR